MIEVSGAVSKGKYSYGIRHRMALASILEGIHGAFIFLERQRFDLGKGSKQSRISFRLCEYIGLINTATGKPGVAQAPSKESRSTKQAIEPLLAALVSSKAVVHASRYLRAKIDFTDLVGVNHSRSINLDPCCGTSSPWCKNATSATTRILVRYGTICTTPSLYRKRFL